MSTKNEIIYSILDTIKPENMTNSNISRELVSYLIDITRVQLITQSLNKGHSIPSNIIQSLGCIPIIFADKAECCSISIDCIIARTEIEIPIMISMHNKEMFTRIGPIDLSLPQYDKINYERVPFESKSRFNFIKSFTTNNSRFIYLLSKSTILLDYINVQGILTTPSDASNFTCEGKSCYNDNSQYPITDQMLNPLMDIISKRLLTTNQIPIDYLNNNQNQSTPQIVNK